MSVSHDFDLETFKIEYLKEFSPAITRGSIGFMSVIRHDLLLIIAVNPTMFFNKFGNESKEYYAKYPELLAVKNDFFEATLQKIMNGNISLVPQLSKGVINRSQLVTFLTLIDTHKDYLLSNGSQRPLLIYPGSFDPMHYGHRIMISSLIERSPADTNLVVNLNSYQARKPHLVASFERRFASLEHHMLRSDLLNPYRVCAMDFRFGAKEDDDHLRQTRMQAYMAGDSRLRWVIGGDKFMSEIARRDKEEMAGVVGRTLSRFNLKNMSIYIVPRKGEDTRYIQKLVNDLNEEYPAEFIYIKEKEYTGKPISSTFIRNHINNEDIDLQQEARKMEHTDLTRSYNG